MSATSNKLAIIEALIESKKKPREDNLDSVKKLADQAIASMRDSVNHNAAVMGEVIEKLTRKPKEFIIQRNARGDMTKVIPVYEKD